MRATMQEGVLFGSETIVAKAPVAVQDASDDLTSKLKEEIEEVKKESWK